MLLLLWCVCVFFVFFSIIIIISSSFFFFFNLFCFLPRRRANVCVTRRHMRRHGHTAVCPGWRFSIHQMIRAYEQKIKDEERRKVDKLKSKHRLTKIRRMRKVGYRASNNRSEKHINKDEILLRAVQNKNSDEVHVMIKGGGDPEYEDSNGDALLHIAVRNDDADCVHALCDWKVSTETLTQKSV